MSRRFPKGVRDDVPLRLEHLQRACREKGLRLTLQRRAVLLTLLETRDHPTADQVHEQLQRTMPDLSRATVFRILDQFVTSGIIGRACHPGRSARYDSRTELHHHLVCLRCESMIDIFDDSLDTIPLPDISSTKFKVVDFRVQIRGLCSQCQQLIRKEEST